MIFRQGDRVRYVGNGDDIFKDFVGHTGTVAEDQLDSDDLVKVKWDTPMPSGAWWNETSFFYARSLERAEFNLPKWKESSRLSAILDAHALVNGDRNDDYGHPYEDFKRSANIWSDILGVNVTPEQVALCMIGVKVSRLSNDIDKRDSWVDIAGYVECWQRIQNRREGLE